MQRPRTPDGSGASRALPDISALASSPGKAGRGAVNSAPLDALLQIVAREHSLLAELLRLSGSLPPPFRLRGVQEGRFARVLFDYRYFKDRAAVEAKVEASPELSQLDEALRETHGEALAQLFGLFEQIVALHVSIVQFLEHLQQGGFIQCTLDTLLTNAQGKQLLCEALALFGALLLALDRRLVGPVRERLVVAFFRLRGGSQAAGPAVNAVIALCAATGLQPARRYSPSGYPEAYFARVPLPGDVVLRLVNTIRADDIYDHAATFPAPEHRTTALASQASLLYLLLCFSPATLRGDGSLMRTLADRHFADSWVVAWGPGFYTDLAVEWDGFKAARDALAGVVSVTRARDVAATAAGQLPGLRAQLAAHLSRGHLSEEYVLEHMPDILGCLRNANAALRWLLLHGIGTQRKLRAAVAAAAPPGEELLALLLDIAQLELEVKEVYARLLETRKERWRAQQAELQASIAGLARFFAALQALPQADAPPDFSAWFDHLHRQVEAMRLEDPGGSSRRVQGVVAALAELERFHSGEASLQTAHYLGGIRAHLAHLLRLADVRPGQLAALAAVSDFAYGWGLLDACAPRLQAQIRERPGTVGRLASLLRKAASALEPPLLRLSQAKSPALEPVSRHYSAALLAFARRLLQVVPASLWEVLDAMAVIATHKLPPPAARVEVAGLREAAQLGLRAQLLGHAARAAALTSGMLAIHRTQLGCLELDAMALLESGVRQMLAMRIAGAAAQLLTFPQASGPLLPASPFRSQRAGLAAVFGGSAGFAGELPGRADLGGRLSELCRRLRGLRGTIEAGQDLLGLAGKQLWPQQLRAVVLTNLQREEAHLGSPPPGGAEAGAGAPLTLVGRLAGELLRLSSPQRTRFLPAAGAWEDGSGQPTLAPQTLRAAAEALGGSGVSALSRLLGLRVRHCLRCIVAGLTPLDAGVAEGLDGLAAALSHASLETGVGGPAALAEASRKAAPLLEPLQEALCLVGQAQLLRRQLAAEQRAAFLLDGGGQLGDALQALGGAVVSHVQQQQQQQQQGQAEAGSSLPVRLDDLVPLSEACGGEDVLRQRFLPPPPLEQLRRLPELLLLVAAAVSREQTFDRRQGLLCRKHKGAPDATVLAVGLGTLLQQLPPSQLQALLRLAGRWVHAYVSAVTGSVAAGVEAAGVPVRLPPEVGTLLALLAELGRFGLVADNAVSAAIPFVYDCWTSLLD